MKMTTKHQRVPEISEGDGGADLFSKKVLGRYEKACAQRRSWEGLWEECYDYALPQRGGF